MNILKVGDVMTDAVLYDLNDKEYKLSSFSDKYVLLSFWSMSCLICMQAVIDLKRTYESYRDKVNIISINMDLDHSRWEQGANRDNVPWLSLSDGKGIEGGVGADYTVMSYPSYVLINPNGIIADRWMGFRPGRFDEKFRAILH